MRMRGQVFSNLPGTHQTSQSGLNLGSVTLSGIMYHPMIPPPNLDNWADGWVYFVRWEVP